MKRQIFRCLGLTLLLIAALSGWAFAAQGDSSDYEAALINADGSIQSTYSTLAEAMNSGLPSGSVVRLEKDVTVTENLRVPSGVTLLLPCMDSDPGYVARYSGKMAFNPDGTDVSSAVGPGAYAELYRKLTVSSGVNVIVQGTILVNAVTGRPAAGHYDMDVTGGYAQIDLEGTIVVADKGTVDCFGYVKGDGLLRAKSGGTVGDLYIVRHWRGGTHGLAMYEEKVYPINEADCRNIEADLRIDYGATLNGLVKMYAGGEYNYTRFPQVDSSNGLIRLAESGSYVLRSYDAVNEREVYEIVGGASFAASTLTIVGVPLTSSDFIYPIDGDMDFILKKGDFSFVNDYKALPGATMTVAGNATLTIAETAYLEDPVLDDVNDDGKVTVVFYDRFEDLYVGPTQYPAGQPAAKIVLEEGSTFTNKGIFAGTIETSEDNVLIGEGIVPGWNVTTHETEATEVVREGYLGERHVKLNFGLDIHREGYTFRIDETGGEILWFKENAVSVDQTLTQEDSEDKVKVKGILCNTTGTDVAVQHLLVAVYDAAGRMLGVDMQEVGVVEVNGELRYSFELPVSGAVSYAKAFIVGQGFVPLWPDT